LFKFLMLFGQLLDMSLQRHVLHLIKDQGRKLEHQSGALSRPSFVSAFQGVNE
jgi:hypothetical protein